MGNQYDGGEPFDFKPATDDDWQAYYAAFGRFMFDFANAEEEINRSVYGLVAFRLLKLGTREGLQGQEVIKALLSGMRLNAARDTLKRLLRVMDAPEADIKEVDRILSHLAEITTLRDQLAHHASFPTMSADGTFQTTNQVSARELMKIEWIVFHPTVLLDAADDLRRIPHMLSQAMSEETRASTTEAAKTSDDWRRSLERFAEPWRYKHARLVRTGPKHDQNPQWRSRPPQSSSE